MEEQEEKRDEVEEEDEDVGESEEEEDEEGEEEEKDAVGEEEEWGENEEGEVEESEQEEDVSKNHESLGFVKWRLPRRFTETGGDQLVEDPALATDVCGTDNYYGVFRPFGLKCIQQSHCHRTIS